MPSPITRKLRQALVNYIVEFLLSQLHYLPVSSGFRVLNLINNEYYYIKVHSLIKIIKIKPWHTIFQTSHLILSSSM